MDVTKPGSSGTTLAGNDVMVKSKGEATFLDDSLVLGWTDMPGGRLVLLEEVPGVTHQMVDQLNATYGHLASQPPLEALAPPEDWQLLRRDDFPPPLLSVLATTSGTGAMVDFLRSTPGILEHLTPGDNFTLLVPTDDAFLAMCRLETSPCAALADDQDLRQALLLGHLVRGYLLPEGVQTLGQTELLVINSIDGRSSFLINFLYRHNLGTVYLDDGVSTKSIMIVAGPIPVADFGSIFLIDRVLAQPLVEGPIKKTQEVGSKR